MALLPQDPEQQKKLLIGLVPILLVFAYWYFMHGKSVEEVTALETRLEKLEATNATAQVQARQGGPELEKKLALYEQHMIRLEQLIPSKEEVPELLHDMTLRAQETGVEIALLRPGVEEPGPHYNRQVYEMEVQGAFHDVGHFLSAVGSLPRIITPIDLDLKPFSASGEADRDGRLRLRAVFNIETYVLPVLPESPAPAETTSNAAT